jgi:hypothetical protein
VYGYADALRDGGVVRPVFFPRLGGQMEWTAPDGTEMSATFDDDLDRTASSQRLRTALSPDGEWLPTVLDQAHAQLLTPAGAAAGRRGTRHHDRPWSTPMRSPGCCGSATASVRSW